MTSTLFEGKDLDDCGSQRCIALHSKGVFQVLRIGMLSTVIVLTILQCVGIWAQIELWCLHQSIFRIALS